GAGIAGAGGAGVSRAGRARPRARGACGGRALRLERRSRLALGRAVRPAGEPARPRGGGSARARRLKLAVVGSINLDLVARCERLPRPGETVTGATFARHPGGKGANQAVAAARLGAEVTMIGCVGDDDFVEPALAGLRD